MHISRILIVCLLVVSLSAATVRADDEAGLAGWVIYYGAMVAIWGGGATSVVVNTVQIAQWDGSYLWGGIGVATGVAIPIWQHATTADMTVGYIAGGIVAGVGLFSLILAATHHGDGDAPSRVQLEPILLQPAGAPLQPGVALSYHF